MRGAAPGTCEPPPSAAYSHSSSVGSRYETPSRFERQAANSFASSNETFETGRLSRPAGGVAPPQSEGGAWFAALTNSAYSALVTSVLSIENAPTVESCAGHWLYIQRRYAGRCVFN